MVERSNNDFTDNVKDRKTNCFRRNADKYLSINRDIEQARCQRQKRARTLTGVRSSSDDVIGTSETNWAANYLRPMFAIEDLNLFS